MPWRAIHVYYHDDDRDRLILEGVRPLFERLAEDVPEAYFVPHWRLGPHLRLHVRADDATYDRLVLPATDEIVGGFLRAHPSTTELDPAAILPLHERLAALEGEHGPLGPWPPNNTIVPETYDERLQVHDNVDTAEMLARFYVATTPLTFDVLAATPNPAQRRRLAFALLLATVEAFSADGLERDFVTFRSHTEAFLHAAPGGAESRREWDAQYARNADHFAAELTEVLATLDGTRTSVPFVRRWVDTLRPIEAAVRTLLEEGRLYLPSVEPRKFEDLSSDFHRALVANPAAMERMRGDDFSVFRQLINYAYLQLTRLGISPIERHALCHFAANTAERHYGRTSVEVISGGGG
ncbi:thiopeptide maturation pyridine synthase [Nocardiopsis suaedae]|uniref:Thiopeptide-type bacteriocin biosynthesis domain-containing protein n=1 Tax=Nocardiopsis suaedae TaxID=3018444 RepID=A0ABT4TI53_9ACTN|nr:thiopeptide maturation pyridine synthase [Nocardiopsis suaedae]MDA2804378.1 hypothetical protein [Nocardiopsis suaedae]